MDPLKKLQYVFIFKVSQKPGRFMSLFNYIHKNCKSFYNILYIYN